MATRIERRFAAQLISQSRLNPHQKAAFSSLEAEGYGLLFMRGKVAICSSGSDFASIDESGDVATNIDISLRR